MESNLLLEQYSWYKKQYLQESPFKCLLNADIELNPHQINAFCAAIQALKTGGIILADEVGLGKTIEAGLVLNYVLDSGAKKVLISLPATLRKQWEVELQEKFGIDGMILDRYTVERDPLEIKRKLEDRNRTSIILTSYDYSSKLIKRFPSVKWDFLIIDEAHNLRNVFHGTKRAKNLYDLTKGIPKILLTATPLQNALSDLHGLVSFIDPRIFGSEKVFNRRFVEGGDYDELKQELLPVLYRTLRRDVGKYMAFSKRTCLTVDFHLSQEEKDLYEATNTFLRKDPLYSIPTANARYVLMHTFAHLLIKQMSMSSGYSSSAIRERIYFGDNMSGVLLYTGSADKEGSLGGLVELGNIDQLIVLMRDAFQEALLCTNDPECLNNTPAGNNSNGAACHSCCMISETACENGNRMLDRGLVVPINGREDQAYFRKLVNDLCQLEV